jgi:hypothetical protein
LEAIGVFVERGGGLLLLGDHTNLLGMSSSQPSVPPVWDRLSIRCRQFLSTGFFSVHETPRWFGPPHCQPQPDFTF